MGCLVKIPLKSWLNQRSDEVDWRPRKQHCTRTIITVKKSKQLGVGRVGYCTIYLFFWMRLQVSPSCLQQGAFMKLKTNWSYQQMLLRCLVGCYKSLSPLLYFIYPCPFSYFIYRTCYRTRQNGENGGKFNSFQLSCTAEHTTGKRNWVNSLSVSSLSDGP